MWLPPLRHFRTETSNAGLDGVVKPLQAQIRLGRPLVQLGNVLTATPATLLATVENGCQNLLEPLRL
jgi:hypothetical protein